jgi:superfamily II DNA/RNA helicase
MQFTDLGLSAEVLRAVADAGYTTPTPIQQQAIPHVLSGRDVLGCAQTGTGKTAGFTLPLIDILGRGRAKARMPRSIILEPTRELAAQVAENFEIYGKYHKLTKALLIGGVSYGDQDKLLDRGVDVLIATPGRLLDQFERGRILLNDVKILVIDEADRMLDMGFIPDVERIAGLTPKIRQTLFFSATMPPEIRRLADKFLSNPVEVAVSPPATAASTVTQLLVPIHDVHAKREVLRGLLRTEQVKNALIFCNRKRDVDVLFRSLKRHGFNVGALHGDMDQGSRTETLESFKRGDIALLVCSDVAARGIDIDDMSHVFNFDVPIHAEDYVHRIGRTGRAGRAGRAVTLATPEDGKHLTAIERMLGKKIDRIEGAAAPAPQAEAQRSEERVDAARSEAPRGEASRSEEPRRGRRDRRPRRDGERRDGERGERREQAAEAPRPAAAPITQGTPEPRPQPVPLRPQPQPQQRRRDQDDDHVVGMGDHVPAFLKRGWRAVG